MSDKDNVRSLVYAYDLETLGIIADISDSLKQHNLEESTFAELCPPKTERSATIAYNACYKKFLETFPDATKEQFDENLNIAAFQQVQQNISTKLPDDVEYSQVKEYQRRKSLSLTRLDKDRQVK